jgi:hypothetical protein
MKHILPACDIVSYCLLYETCKQMMRLVTDHGRTRLLTLAPDYKPSQKDLRLIKYLPAPACVGMIHRARQEYATYFLGTHITMTLIDWAGVVQLRHIHNALSLRSDNWHNNPLVLRLRALPRLEAGALCHALIKRAVCTQNQLALLFVYVGDPAVFSPAVGCPWLALHRVDDLALDAAFGSGRVEMVRLVATQWGRSYRDGPYPMLSTLARVCAGSAPLYDEFCALLSSSTAKVGDIQSLRYLPWWELPDLTADAWERISVHLKNAPDAHSWAMVFVDVIGHSTGSVLGLYDWIKRQPATIWNSVAAVMNLIGNRLLLPMEVWKRLRDDGIMLPEPQT